MGHIVDGILFYGIDLGIYEDKDLFDEVELADSQGDSGYGRFGVWGWEAVYLEKAHGLVLPPTVKSYPFGFLQKHTTLIQDSPCLIGVMGQYEDAMVDYVALRAAHHTTFCSEPLEVATVLPIPKAEADAKIKAFCELMGLPYSEPKWLLAACST